MFLPLRNRCVGLKFLEFRHRLAYKFINNCHCDTHFFVIKIIKIVHFFFLNCRKSIIFHKFQEIYSNYLMVHFYYINSVVK